MIKIFRYFFFVKHVAAGKYTANIAFSLDPYYVWFNYHAKG